jgi:hypothetical protein
MIYENVELHGIDEVRELEDGSGVALQRVPEDVRQALNECAQTQMLRPGCAEIRFVSDDPVCELTMSCGQADDWSEVTVVPFFGAYQHSETYKVGPEKRTITITKPETLRKTDAECLDSSVFSPNVWRFICWGGQVQLHGVRSSGIRPPKPEELPGIRLLTYGTSITHGHCASGPHLSYASLAARALGVDLINLGSGGSAQCEKKLSDYIAARDDWDIASLALSVNMGHFQLDEFYDRVSYMVNTVSGANTNRPVACITLWPYFNDMTSDGGKPRKAEGGTAEEFRQSLRDAVAACPNPNVCLLEGPELLTDTAGLGGDLIHPGDYGMMEMGINLAAKLKPLLSP